MDMTTGEIQKSNHTYEAMTLYRAYQKFQEYLMGEGYEFHNTTKEQPTEYLLVANKEPVVSSSMIKCVMKPKITGRDTCSQEVIDDMDSDYNMLLDAN
jgi:hypothetical protein